MERIELAIDHIEIENNLSDMDDDQLYELIHIFNGEKERRDIRKLLIKEMANRICSNTVEIEWFEDEED